MTPQCRQRKSCRRITHHQLIEPYYYVINRLCKPCSLWRKGEGPNRAPTVEGQAQRVLIMVEVILIPKVLSTSWE